MSVKLNLGKFITIILFLQLAVWADTPYHWTLKSNKSSVYVNEAIEIEYTCHFDDKAFLYVIEFTPQNEKKRDYRILSLGVKEGVSDGKRSATYRYVLFPKVAGNKVYAFQALMRKTTQASIENSAIGRDNVEDYAFNDQKMALPPVEVVVKAHQERMTGQFTLKVSLDTKDVKAYTPVHLDLHMRGEGDFDQMQDINLSIDGVKVFSEPGEHHYRLTKEGFKGEWEQKFSLVSDKDFVIDPIEIAYFDIKKKRRIVLKSDRYEIKVAPAYEVEALLDDAPENESFSWWYWSYLNYVMTFILGVLAHYYFARFQAQRVIVALLGDEEKIRQCRSTKQLLTRLIMRDDDRFDTVIQKYENLGDKDLASLKRDALKIIKDS